MWSIVIVTIAITLSMSLPKSNFLIDESTVTPHYNVAIAFIIVLETLIKLRVFKEKESTPHFLEVSSTL